MKGLKYYYQICLSSHIGVGKRLLLYVSPYVLTQISYQRVELQLSSFIFSSIEKEKKFRFKNRENILSSQGKKPRRFINLR